MFSKKVLTLNKVVRYLRFVWKPSKNVKFQSAKWPPLNCNAIQKLDYLFYIWYCECTCAHLNSTNKNIIFHSFFYYFMFTEVRINIPRAYVRTHQYTSLFNHIQGSFTFRRKNELLIQLIQKSHHICKSFFEWNKSQIKKGWSRGNRKTFWNQTSV